MLKLVRLTIARLIIDQCFIILITKAGLKMTGTSVDLCRSDNDNDFPCPMCVSIIISNTVPFKHIHTVRLWPVDPFGYTRGDSPVLKHF